MFSNVVQLFLFTVVTLECMFNYYLLEAALLIQKMAATIQKWILLFLYKTGEKDLRYSRNNCFLKFCTIVKRKPNKMVSIYSDCSTDRLILVLFFFFVAVGCIDEEACRGCSERRYSVSYVSVVLQGKL